MDKEVLDRLQLTGQIYREVDGYFVFAPNDRGGFFDAQSLRAIADYLDQLNKDWDAQIQEDMRSLSD